MSTTAKSSGAEPYAAKPGRARRSATSVPVCGGVWRWLSSETAAVVFLLIFAAWLYTWQLDRNGWANPYYSAAAQSGATNWTAWFYGSADAGSLVTIDKTPLSVWIVSLSVRFFGLSSWSILLPQAFMGVLTTWLIYKTIRTTSTAAASLLGAALYATTPVVVLMSRFNNPEPLMGLLVVAAAFFAVRAIEEDRWRWFFLCGAALGAAFMAKQIQALLVVPSVMLAVLILGKSPIGRRIVQLLGTLGVFILVAGWWLIVVELVPASQRPYVGGSATNSALQLTAGYNGLARFSQFTNQNGIAVAGQPPSILETFQSGLSRLYNADFAQESAWLLFASLACAAVLLVLKHPESDQKIPPVALLAAIWLLTVAAVLCFAGTMVHSYYTFSLAAPMSIVLSLGLQHLWKGRHRPITRLMGAVVLASTGYLGSRILEYGNGWPPYWDVILLGAGVVSALLWAFRWKENKLLVLLPAVMSMLLGPVMADVYTINTPQKGTNPLSGVPSQVEGSLSDKFRTALGGKDHRTLQLAFGGPPGPELLARLRTQNDNRRWTAMTVGGQNAALYQLESGTAVAAIGGWLGLDPAPTLPQFKEFVAEGQVGLFIDQPDLLRSQGVGKEADAIIQWVRDNFELTKVSGASVYDLASAYRG